LVVKRQERRRRRRRWGEVGWNVGGCFDKGGGVQRTDLDHERDEVERVVVEHYAADVAHYGVDAAQDGT